MSDAREQERQKSGYQEKPSDLEMLEPDQLEVMELDDLLKRFAALAVAKDEADGIPQGDRLYWQLDYIVRELERRDGDQRRALLPLYAHQDIRVR